MVEERGQRIVTPPHAIPTVPPRRNQNEGGHPTAPPEATDFEPREGLPEPESVEQPGAAQHWRKHPSDFHADCAVSHMGNALGEADTLRRGQELQIAEIHARLSLRDAVLEATATLKELVPQLLGGVESRRPV